MKFLVLLGFFALASAGTVPLEPIQIVRQESDVNFDGTYQHSFETANGISVQEQGVLKNAGQKDAAEEVIGSYEYTAPDGQKVVMTYVANEFGFQPEGSHLPVAPTPPPIPAAIARALDWIAAHPQKEEPTKKF